MRYIDLDLIKKHLLIDEFWDGDDILLEAYGTAAEEVVEKYLDCPLTDNEDEDGNIPRALISAILLMVGHYYNQREAVTNISAVEVPLGFKLIIDLFKNQEKPF